MADSVPIYDSAHRAHPIVEELVQSVRYRDLIKQLVRRDILTRYKRSFLGVAWTMLNPLGTMLVLTLAFSSLFASTSGYAVYLLSGLIVWTFFAQTTTAAMAQLAWGGALIHRIYLPRAVFAISSVGTGLVNLVLSLMPLVLVMVVTKVPLQPAALFLPLSILLLAMFALGVGLLLSTVAVYFPDVTEMYQIVLIAWMYLTPIIYPEQIIPAHYRWWMLNLNPMYHLVKLFRQPLYFGLWPTLPRFVWAFVVAAVTLAVGWIVFTRRADEFPYRV